MKRDWMQAGRKPSGLCSAELYIAALSHGYDYTKADIAAAVHVCEATLSKRLIEFENTDSGSLTNIIGDKHNSAITSGEVVGDSVDPKDPGGEGKNGSAVGDSESLSDIDDLEVDGYLHNEQETQFKKVIWEEMNKEYLEEQAAKEALAAELASRGVVMEEGKRKRRKHNEDAKNSTPAQTPAEATQNMLKRKRLGSKINDEAVNKLYNTNDEDSKADEEMAFNDDHGQHTGDGETFEGGTDYPDYNYMMAMVMESTTIMMLIFNTS